MTDSLFVSRSHLVGRIVRIGTIVLLGWISPIVAQACLNAPGTTLDGGHRGSFYPQTYYSLRKARDATAESQRAYLRTAGPEDDVMPEEVEAVSKIFVGLFEEAIEAFKAIESKYPGRYSTAANLGTAYELHGDLELARQWIAEGIHRNPESHASTEWLHLAILNTRIKLQTEPAYLDHHFIIDLPGTISMSSKFLVEGRAYSLEQVSMALVYQLRERLVFVKPQDPVVANLLFSLSVIEANTAVVEEAIPLMEMAREYGFRDNALMATQMSNYRRAITLGEIRFYLPIVLGGLGLVAFLIFAYKRKWFFLSSATYRKHQQEKLDRSEG